MPLRFGNFRLQEAYSSAPRRLVRTRRPGDIRTVPPPGGAHPARVSTVPTPQTRAAARARPAPVKEKASATPRNELLEWIKSIAAAVVLFLIIRTFLVQAYSIPSNSMEDTLLVGDYLMANNAVF